MSTTDKLFSYYATTRKLYIRKKITNMVIINLKKKKKNKTKQNLESAQRQYHGYVFRYVFDNQHRNKAYSVYRKETESTTSKQLIQKYPRLTRKERANHKSHWDKITKKTNLTLFDGSSTPFIEWCLFFRGTKEPLSICTMHPNTYNFLRILGITQKNNWTRKPRSHNSLATLKAKMVSSHLIPLYKFPILEASSLQSPFNSANHLVWSKCTISFKENPAKPNPLPAPTKAYKKDFTSKFSSSTHSISTPL
jgi:hypothetical protein